MRDVDLYRTLLGLTAPWAVDGVDADLTGPGAVGQGEAAPGPSPVGSAGHGPRSRTPGREALMVGRAWVFQERCRTFGEHCYAAARTFFTPWYGRATHRRLTPTATVATLTDGRLPRLFTYVRRRLADAGLERVNAAIPWVKQTVHGFRNAEDFEPAISFHFGASISTHPKAGRALLMNACTTGDRLLSREAGGRAPGDPFPPGPDDARPGSNGHDPWPIRSPGCRGEKTPPTSLPAGCAIGSRRHRS